MVFPTVLKIGYLALSVLLALPAVRDSVDTGDPMGDRIDIVDFGDTDRTEWRVVNDGVMGGLSRGNIRRTDKGTGVFSGELSLENNGGFSSVRALVGPLDLSMFRGLELRVLGDGRVYQLRLRTDDRFDGIAYRAEFETRDGEWMTIRLDFGRFVPTFRGRVLSDVPPLDTSGIQQLAFMLADKTPGPFSLEIDFVRAWEADSIEP